MSSWLKNPQVISLAYNKLFCKTSTSGFGTNFFNFFMCYLYARSKNEILYLNDMKNNISSSYHLILDTFNESPNIKFTLYNGITIQQQDPIELNKYYLSLDIDFLKSEAKRIFKLKPDINNKITLLIKDLPQFDIGIHIRTGDKISSGEMKPINQESYVNEITYFQKICNKTKLNIYLMTDSSNVIKKIKELAHESWSVYSLTSPSINPDGHLQKQFNTQPTSVKMGAFIHFLAEIRILQECPNVICTFSSNIGRFINLTGNYLDIKSLD